MRDQYGQGPWDQDEVEIEDLGAPSRGISRYIFALGEKWCIVAPLRARLTTLLAALCLLIAVLLPGASGANTNTQTPGTHSSAPGNSSPSTIYLIDCGITVNVNSLPSQVYVWEQVVSTPAAQECRFFSHPASKCPTPQQLMSPSTNKGVAVLCIDGTPLPGPAGKNGKNR